MTQMLKDIFCLIIFPAFYILAISAIFFVLFKIGVSGGRVILSAISIFGLISGALVWAWPFDSAAYPNVTAMLL